MNHSDKQISFYSCLILSNLAFFPKHIESRIYSEKNLKKIMEFILKNDFDFGVYYIILMINFNTNSIERRILIANGEIERLIYLINNNLDKLESKQYIFLIRLILNIFKYITEDDEDKCNVKYNKVNTLQLLFDLLPFVKKTIKDCFVNNPWANYDDGKFYVEILLKYSIYAVRLDKINLIIEGEFTKTLIELYYKLNNEEIKNKLMRIYCELLSKDDSISQLFIDEGILGLLLNEINRIEYKDYQLLNSILFACSNLACGNMGQIESMSAQGLVWKTFEIIIFLKDKNIQNEIKLILFNAFYTLGQVITGGSFKVRMDIILYNDYEILNIMIFILNNILDKDNKKCIFDLFANSIFSLIQSAESEMSQDGLSKFKNELIGKGYEEIVSKILSDENIDKDTVLNLNLILEFIINK